MNLGMAFFAVTAVLILISLSAFTVDERESAMVFQLGEIRRVIDKPGLHWKIPVVQRVRYFDKRLLTLDTPDTESFQTKEKKPLLVDSFVQWRIADVRMYYTRFSGGEPLLRATTQLSQLVNSALRAEFSERTVQEVVSGKREEVMQAAFNKVQEGAAGLGIEVIDVRLKRVELPPQVSESVYGRMSAERRAAASQSRSQGFSEAEKIRADADRQREVIIADAYRKAQTIKGEGDARAAAIYAKAFSANPEFYAFYRSLDVYTKAFSNRNDMLVLDPNSEFFKYFKNPNRGSTGK
ncbi:MAG TPA: protease modulator HflC [Burkholderiales bacterium]|nr:protease modulator HflC [Burkholderiales bacterium]